MSTQIDQPSSTTAAGQDPSSSQYESLVPDLIPLLTSYGPVGDRFSYFVIGGVLDFIRRFLGSAWRGLMNQFWITITLKDYNDSYYWMMFWLSKQPAWARCKDLSTTTMGSFGIGSHELVEGEADDNSQRRITFMPSYGYSVSLWYRGHYIRLTRDGGILIMGILARDHKIVNQLLLEAKNAWKAGKEEFISIYSSCAQGGWRLITYRPKRPLSSIILDVGIKEKILDDAKDFLKSKKWYTERGIPFRRGYLLYGAPGSGKTSIIQSLAGELGLDVYIISLSRSGLDDYGLQELIADLPETCIALMEDIDAAFHHSISRAPENSEKPSSTSDKEQESSSEDTPKISLSGLLNALDGIGAQEGRLLFATTNRYEALDTALRRPGRMDVHVEFKLASQYQAAELFKRFYMPGDITATGAENIADDGRSDKDCSVPPKEPLVDLELPKSEKVPHSERREFGFTELMLLSEKFKDHIPDRELSMAALQGYLMMHKGRPYGAVECVEAWVQAERVKKGEVVEDNMGGHVA